MAVDEITSVNPIPPAAQQIAGNAGIRTSARLRGTNQAQAAAVPQQPDPILQNELLINETLRTLNSVPGGSANTPLINVTPAPLTDPEATQGNVILQNELLINQALQNLSFVSRPRTDTLLINETPAELAADDTLQNLNAAQQNQLLTNQALFNLNATAQTATPAAAAAQATGVAAAAPQQALAAAPQAAEQAPAAAIAAAAATVPVVPPALGEVTTVLTPTPIAATFVTQQLTPFPVPFFLENPDRTPYVLAVYETRNPNPAPEDPAPIPNEVRPPLPADRTRQIGRAALRQAWSNYQTRVYEENIHPATPVGERNLRHVLTQVNADMAANGLPLHLVFARNEAGYALNVYDCSDTELCRLTRDVPLKFEDLTITNLQQETGIIINTTS